VENLTEVPMNGKPPGTVWHALYRMDATTLEARMARRNAGSAPIQR
jgi:hypothetical protein